MIIIFVQCDNMSMFMRTLVEKYCEARCGDIFMFKVKLFFSSAETETGLKPTI